MQASSGTGDESRAAQATNASPSEVVCRLALSGPLPFSFMRPLGGKRRRFAAGCWCCGNPACAPESMPVDFPTVGDLSDGVDDSECGPLIVDTHVHLDEVFIKIQVHEEVPSMRKLWDEMTEKEQRAWRALGLDRSSWTVSGTLREDKSKEEVWQKCTTKYGSSYYCSSLTGEMVWEWDAKRADAGPEVKGHDLSLQPKKEIEVDRFSTATHERTSVTMSSPSQTTAANGSESGGKGTGKKPLVCWRCGVEGHPARLCPASEVEADLLEKPVWQVCTTKYGAPFYWNRKSGKTSWQKPLDWDGSPDDLPEKDKIVAFYDTNWEHLLPREREAAISIGYTEGTWDQSCIPAVPSAERLREFMRRPSFACITTGCDPHSLESILQLHRYMPLPPERADVALVNSSFPGLVWVELGCHPKTAAEMSLLDDDKAWAALGTYEAQLRAAAKEVGKRLIAWGEIGLDYSHPLYGKVPRNRWFQKVAFKRQLAIGLELGLPLCIHSRAAWEDTINILRDLVPPDYLLHIHCFWDDKNAMEELFATYPRAVIGFSNNIFYAGDIPWQLCQCVPLENIVLETDAPYLPRTGAMMSTPGDIVAIGRKIAQLRGIPCRTLMDAVRQNVLRVYGV